MLKKGFDLFKPHPPFLYNIVFSSKEVMCCDVCKGCLFYIGELICKFRKATIVEFDNYCLNGRGKRNEVCNKKQRNPKR